MCYVERGEPIGPDEVTFFLKSRLNIYCKTEYLLYSVFAPRFSVYAFVTCSRGAKWRYKHIICMHNYKIFIAAAPRESLLSKSRPHRLSSSASAPIPAAQSGCSPALICINALNRFNGQNFKRQTSIILVQFFF